MFATAGTAFATPSVEYVSGSLNFEGTLVQYPTYRTHTYPGIVSMSIDDMVQTYLRLGLRDTANVQFTNSEQWDTYGTKHFHLSSNGSDQIAQGKRFAFNGRMGATSIHLNNFWGGTLTY